MDVKSLRWPALVLGLCAATAIVTTLVPLRGDNIPSTEVMRRLDVEMARLRTASASVDRALGRYRAALASDHWQARAARNDAGVMVDPSVPAASRPFLDRAMQTARKSLGLADSRARAGALLYLDTSMVALRKGVDRRPFRAEVTYFIPDAADAPCAAVTRIRRTDIALNDGEVFGPCAFIAAFGAPGRQIREWLGRTDWTAARWSGWARGAAGAGAGDVKWFELSDAQARCANRGTGCLTMAGLGADRSPGESEHDAARTVIGPYETHDSAWAPQAQTLDRRLLSDMVAEFGAERFRAFWTSPDAPAVAFERATGTSMEGWLRAWMSARVARPVSNAGVSGSSVLWLAALAPLLIMAAIRPRDRVRRDAR